MEIEKSRTIVTYKSYSKHYEKRKYLRVNSGNGGPTWYYGQDGRAGEVRNEELYQELEEEFQKVK